MTTGRDSAGRGRSAGGGEGELARRPLAALWQGMMLPLQGGGLLLRLSGVKRWALLPVLVNLVVYLVAVAGVIWWLGSWDWQMGGTEWKFWGGVGGWLYRFFDRFLDVIKWVVGLPLLFIICYFTFTSVGMIVASPLHDFLSERVELAICEAQERPQWSLWEQVRLSLRSMRDSLIIVVRQVGAMVVTLPFLLVPYVGFLPLFLVMAYYTGLGFLDVAMARNNLRHAQKKPMIRRCRWQLLGMGLAMEWMFLVPFAGLFLLPMGVVAGTVLYCRADWVEMFRRLGMNLPPGFVAPRIRGR